VEIDVSYGIIMDEEPKQSYYERNKEKVRERNKSRADAIKEYNRQYYLRNRHHIAETSAEWRRKNFERAKEIKRKSFVWNRIKEEFNLILLE